MRYRFRGAVDDQPADLPADGDSEVVLGSSLLALFLNILILGATVVILAHIMFCISFVVS